MPHVALNAQLLSLAPGYRSAGISWYIFHLLQHLPEGGSGYRFTAYTGEKRWPPPRGMEVSRTRWPTQNPAVRIAWEQIVQPARLLWNRVDLLHSMAYVAPIAWRGPSVVTVLDMSFQLFPERFRPWNRLYLRLLTGVTVRRASRIIAISSNTRQDVVRLLGVAETKVDVVPCGVDSSFRPLSQDQQDAFRLIRGLPGRYMLFLGTLEPRKNICRLLEAYHLLRVEWPCGKGPPPSLVIAGARGWYFAEIEKTVERLGLRSEVRLVGYLPPEELPLWYASAELFVYPSLYEGFGLPVLEAMACGTAVITSNRSSLPEVSGDAGVLVNPESVSEIAHAMRNLLTQPDTRHELERCGLARAAHFSWDRTARDTIAVYERALGRGMN